uniref:Secreted protein n=1 Tax=Monodelphis domestica TaxID=13616 RepID=A0A5F8GUA4_MONDO
MVEKILACLCARFLVRFALCRSVSSLHPPQDHSFLLHFRLCHVSSEKMKEQETELRLWPLFSLLNTNHWESTILCVCVCVLERFLQVMEPVYMA